MLFCRGGGGAAAERVNCAAVEATYAFAMSVNGERRREMARDGELVDSRCWL